MKKIYSLFVKRLLDILISITALIVLLPVLLIVALLVRVKIGTPIIFKQARPGKDEKIFRMYKFRTMTDKVDEQGILLPDDVRLTKFGKFLRSTSLDELPELWNILIGNMSVIGPRPLLVEYLDIYNESQKIRHEVRPGLTGWAQVNGRNTLSWKEKFNLDIEYVSSLSLFLDMKIFFLTIKKVLVREGINAEGSVTTEKFNGEN